MKLVTILKLSFARSVLAPPESNNVIWRQHRSFLWRYKEFCSLSQHLIYDMCTDEWSRFTICHYTKQANQFIIFRKAGFHSPISFTILTFVSFNVLCLSYLLWGVWVFFLGSVLRSIFPNRVCRERWWQCWKCN